MQLGRHSYCLGSDSGFAVCGNFTRMAKGVYFHGPDNHECIYNRDLVSTFDFGDWHVGFTRSGLTNRITTIIGNDVWIGEDAKIMCGVTIGDGAIVGAHTVVGKDVPPYAVVVGNPFQIKRFRFPPEIIEKLLKIKWWDWDDQTIQDRLNHFKDINDFIETYG